jgi:hypothetical protein
MLARPSAAGQKQSFAKEGTVEKLSGFEYRAVDTLVRSDPEREVFLAQLAMAEVSSRDYTGVGVYVDISIPSTAPKVGLARWKIEDMLIGHADHPALTAGAGLIVWLRNGLITCLEAYTYDEGWPTDEALFRVTSSKVGP